VGTVHDDRPQVIGNKTEAALPLWAKLHHNDDVDARRTKASFGAVGGIEDLFPFSSARKCMSVLVSVGSQLMRR
jgi:magnesium-transporting ATPase (P-type)